VAVGSIDPSIARLGRHLQGSWVLTLCPAAAQASGAFVSARRPASSGVRGMAADPERSAEEAGRRASSRLQLYVVANRLNRFGTLTYAGEGCFDQRQVRDDTAVWLRRMRLVMGGNFPYAWVTEWHKTHGLHVHFTVGQFIHRSLIESAWGRGFIKIKLIGDLPVGSGTVEESRIAARYIAKYVSKDFKAPGTRDINLRRFSVAKGYQPELIRLQGVSRADVMAQAVQIMGRRATRAWYSQDAEDWRGAPALTLQW
jgi:hypothetical protein